MSDMSRQVIEAATRTPAATIGWADRIGSLAVGREADVAVRIALSCLLHGPSCCDTNLSAHHTAARPHSQCCVHACCVCVAYVCVVCCCGVG